MDSRPDVVEPLLGTATSTDESERRVSQETQNEVQFLPVSEGGWRSDLEAADPVSVKPDAWRLEFGKNLSKDVFADQPAFSPGARDYYKKQREAIAGFEEVDAIDASAEDPVEDGRKKMRESFAISLSNMCNVLLLMVKVFAAVESRSLSIAASTLDSLLDLLAGLVLWLTRIAMRDKDPYKYPIGKLRVQPVGIIVFACIMATLGLQVLLTGAKQLVEHDASVAHMGHLERLYVIVVMGTAIVTKLALFLYCRTFDNEIVRAYAQDHYFDIVTNLVGLAAALIASKFLWWIDPVGAITLAVYTITVWSNTVLENAVSLVGKSASPELLRKVTYMAYIHDPQVMKIRTVRAYTVGTFFFVEVDLEVADTVPLRDARQIAQSLQEKLELLPEVERAFVHPYASFHRPDGVRAEPPAASLHKTASSRQNSGRMDCL